MIQQKKGFFLIQNTFFNIKSHQKIEKKILLVCFNLKDHLNIKDNTKIVTRKVTYYKYFFYITDRKKVIQDGYFLFDHSNLVKNLS